MLEDDEVVEEDEDEALVEYGTSFFDGLHLFGGLGEEPDSLRERAARETGGVPSPLRLPLPLPLGCAVNIKQEDALETVENYGCIHIFRNGRRNVSCS